MSDARGQAAPQGSAQGDLPQPAPVVPAIRPYYQDASVTLYLGDCREILPQLGPVDHVITDPPFSDQTHARARSNRGSGKDPVTAIDFTAIDFTAIDFTAIEWLLVALGPVCRRWFVAFMDWRHIAELERKPPSPWEFVRFGVWVKTNPMPQLTADRPANGWDGIAYLHNTGVRKRWNGGGDHGNWSGPVVTDGLHPTGKPIGLLTRLVMQHTDAGDLILDLFGGSGTTAVAAKRLGRRCILIEREEKYCEVAATRLQQSALDLWEPATSRDAVGLSSPSPSASTRDLFSSSIDPDPPVTRIPA